MYFMFSIIYILNSAFSNFSILCFDCGLAIAVVNFWSHCNVETTLQLLDFFFSVRLMNIRLNFYSAFRSARMWSKVSKFYVGKKIIATS